MRLMQGVIVALVVVLCVAPESRAQECAWSPLDGVPAGGSYLSLAGFDDGSGVALYAGGWFSHVDGQEVNHIARWDGAAWSPLSGPGGTGIGPLGSPEVHALTVFDDGHGASLFVGGNFFRAGGQIVNNIARWDGSAWSALPGPTGTGVDDGVDQSVLALTVFDDGSGAALYAGGSFSTAGGQAVSRIARWDGAEWSPLAGPGGTGVGGSEPWVFALTVFDDGAGEALYAGGRFTTAGGQEVNGIARWDGTGWSALSGPEGTGIAGSGPWVSALTVFDDGEGEALYLGGRFTIAGGHAIHGIARWDGTDFSPLAAPAGTIGNDVNALATFDDGTGELLYAGGRFFTGGQSVGYIAAWRCDASCPADLAPPFGVLDIFDVLEFLALFEAEDPAADLAPPFGVFDIFDVIEYLDLFEQGCP